MFCEIFLGFAGKEDKVKSFALIHVYNLENENSIQVGGVWRSGIGKLILTPNFWFVMNIGSRV